MQEVWELGHKKRKASADLMDSMTGDDNAATEMTFRKIRRNMHRIQDEPLAPKGKRQKNEPRWRPPGARDPVTN